jgi:hypothetical protein
VCCLLPGERRFVGDSKALDPARLDKLRGHVVDGLKATVQGTSASAPASAGQQFPGSTHINALVILSLYLQCFLARFMDTIPMTGLSSKCGPVARLLAHLACVKQLREEAEDVLAGYYRVDIVDVRVDQHELPPV